MSGSKASQGKPPAASPAPSPATDALGSLLAIVPGMVYRCRPDQEWTILVVSAGCRAITGYAPEDLIGNRRVSFGSLIDPEDRVRVEAEVHAGVQAGSPFELSYRLRRADGEVRWIRETVHAAAAADGGYLREGYAMDVTAQREKEVQLRESEQINRAIIDQTFQFIGLLDNEGRLLRANQTSLNAIGMRAEAVIGRYFWDTPWWTHSVDEQSRLQDAVARVAAGEFVRFETSHPTDDGRLLSMDFSLKPIRDGDGRVTGMVAEGRDVTDRRRAEDALKASEEKFSSAFHASPDAVVLSRADTHRIVDCNEGFERIFGWTRAEAIGRTSAELGLWDNEADRTEVLARVVATGSIKAFRGIGRNRQGERRHVLLDIESAMIGGVPHLVVVTHDITDQVRSERALLDSEERFAKAFNASPDSITLTELATGRMTDCNRGFERMFGWSRAEAIGRTTLELGLWDDPRQREQLARQVRSGATVRDMRAVGRRKGGARCEALVSLELAEIGGCPHLILVARDITEQVYAEKALRDSEERFAKAFHASPDSITISDLESHQMIDCNEGFERMFGYTRQEVVGKSTAKLGVWVDPQARREVVQRVRTTGWVRDHEVRARTKEGRIIDCQLAIYPATISGRSCVITVARDVTARLAAERALRESEEKFAKAFRAGPHGLTISELETGRYLDVNQGFEETFGYSREEVIGRTSAELQIWNDLGDRDRLTEQLRKDGEVRGLELVFRHRSGRPIQGRCSCELIELAGRPCIVMVTEDVTAQREADRSRLELENQLRQAQRLDALGQLAGGIAHDFNNILTGVMAYTELALMEVHRPAEVKKHLTEVRKAGERAKELVKQILAFSRQQKQERKPVRMHTSMREAVKLLRSTLPRTIGIESDIASSAPVVLADLTQVHQVLLNLGTNAAHAMRGRAGRLTVGLCTVEVTAGDPAFPAALRPGRHAMITVSDTGHGMDEAVRARIFEPFFTTKAPGEGTGLGLSVVHGIIEDHDGVIAVESRPGEGTTFRLFFPEHVSPESEPVTAMAAAPKGHGQRILFIDDEKMVADVVGRLLTRLGYRASTYTDPEAALAAFAAEPGAFDLIFTDLTMPGITGVEVARRARELRPEIRVIMATGYTGSWTAENLRSFGISALVQKPLTPDSLAEVVAAALAAGPAGQSGA